jgi:hypothetical protein
MGGYPRGESGCIETIRVSRGRHLSFESDRRHGDSHSKRFGHLFVGHIESHELIAMGIDESRIINPLDKARMIHQSFMEGEVRSDSRDHIFV